MNTSDAGAVGRSLLLFDVSGCLCAFPVQAIREIVHIAADERVPGQPSILHGFLNLHGEPIAIVSLSRLFGLAEQVLNLYSLILLIRIASDTIGVLADSVEGVSVVAASDLRPLPVNHSFNDCAEAQFTSEDRVATLLACDRILLEKERRCLAEVTELARRRLDELSSSHPSQS